MQKIKSFLKIVLSFVIILAGCSKRTTIFQEEEPPVPTQIEVPQFGNDENLEIVSWNIENFPKEGDNTITDVAEIIKDLKADIFAVQEIADTVAFRQLLNKLQNYNGIYSPDVYGDGSYQKTAFIYKKYQVQISGKEVLFSHDGYSFPRPPMQVYVRATNNNETFDFTLITLHLKATNEGDSPERRRSAIGKLKEYLDGQMVSNPDKDFVVAGDWNDELTDQQSSNVFQVLLDDSQDYQFVTRPLAQDPAENATYIKAPYRSVIDHILISSSLFGKYQAGSVQPIKIEQFFNKYVSEVSDHRPVGIQFPVFN